MLNVCQVLRIRRFGLELWLNGLEHLLDLCGGREGRYTHAAMLAVSVTASAASRASPAQWVRFAGEPRAKRATFGS